MHQYDAMTVVPAPRFPAQHVQAGTHSAAEKRRRPLFGWLASESASCQPSYQEINSNRLSFMIGKVVEQKDCRLFKIVPLWNQSSGQW